MCVISLSKSYIMQSQLLQTLSQPNFLSLNHSSSSAFPQFLFSNFSSSNSALSFSAIRSNRIKMTSVPINSSISNLSSTHPNALKYDCSDLDRFADVANQLADAAGNVIRKYFRTKFDILDKEDLSPVTIADKEAEESMVKIIQAHFPSHAIFGEENGWMCKEEFADFVWVLDPIDGTKSFITGKPVFGTLIALLYKGKPILGIIDQPVLRERWTGISGRTTTMNGEEISTRNCSHISKAYLYTTSPHLFSEDAGMAFARVRSKVKVPLYGCDCYAYALLASGYVDLVIESGLKPYDFLSLIPVIEGAGGVVTDWEGQQLHWVASSNAKVPNFNIVAAGDKQIHQEALATLQWTN